MSALLGAAAAVGIESEHAPQAWVGLISVTVAFIAIYVWVLYDRKKWLDTFVWVPSYNLMIQANGYALPPVGEIEGVVWKTVQAWGQFHAAELILKSDINWVFFTKGLNENVFNTAHRKVKGFTIAGTHSINVDYDQPTDPLEKTAFEHELGHVIHGNATGIWDEEEHHLFMRVHGLKT